MFSIHPYQERINQALECLKERHSFTIEREQELIDLLREGIDTEIFLLSPQEVQAAFCTLYYGQNGWNEEETWRFARTLIIPQDPHKNIAIFLIAAFARQVTGNRYLNESNCRCWYGHCFAGNPLQRDQPFSNIKSVIRAIRRALIQKGIEISSPMLSPTEEALWHAQEFQKNVLKSEEDTPLDPENNLPFALFLQLLVELYQQYPVKEKVHVPSR